MPGPYTSFTYGDPARLVWGYLLPLAQAQPSGDTSIVGSLFSCAGDILLGPPVWPSMTFCSDGVVGVSYSQQFDLSPYSGPITFTPPSGTLPPGLSLTNVGGDVGLLSGTPTTPGSYTFTLRATNSYGTADKSFTIVISTAAAAGSSWAWVA